MRSAVAPPRSTSTTASISSSSWTLPAYSIRRVTGQTLRSGSGGYTPGVATESKGTRLDRELNELLQELRVVLPGIQVLFAFLLTVPFTQGFTKVTDSQRVVYFVAFGATALSSILLIAPSVQHRLRWRQHDKESLLREANRLVVVGTFLLAVAIDAAAFLVADFIYDTTTAAVTAGIVAAVTTLVWWVWPLSRELQDRD